MIIKANFKRSWFFDVEIEGEPLKVVLRFLHSRSPVVPDMIDVVIQRTPRLACGIGRLIRRGDEEWEWRAAWRRESYTPVIELIARTWPSIEQEHMERRNNVATVPLLPPRKKR